jgi:hypothetical protein
MSSISLTKPRGHKRPVLSIARSSTVRFLNDETGAPVWPCADDEDEERLQATARLFGGSISRVSVELSPNVIATNLETGPTVVGLGGEVEAVARLYAHLTGRLFRRAPTPAEAVKCAMVRVIVHLAPSVPFQLLDEIARGKLNARIGLLWASDLDDLRRQVLVRSAAVKLTPTLKGRAVLFSPTVGRTVSLRIGELEIRGAADSQEDIDEIADSAVLAVTTHSDGIDAMLGPKLTLCGLKGSSRLAELSGPKPRCVLTKECHRQAMSFDEAMSSARLVPPGRLAGRVLIWNSCFGIMTQLESVRDAWGLLPRILESPRIGSLVVLRAVVNTSTAAVIPLVADLQGGRPVGPTLESWKDVLVGSPSELVGDRMFIFGDPEVVANPTTVSDESAIPSEEDADSNTVTEQTDGGLIRHYLSAVKPCTPEETNAVTRCQDALAAFELEIATSTGNSYDLVAHRLRSALIDVMKLRDWSLWTVSWLLGIRATSVLSGKICAFCEAQLFAAIYQPAPVGSTPRYYSNCARCGAVDDRPETDPAVVTISTDGLELRSGGPVEDWTGALWTVPSPPLTGWGEWPRDPTGAPVRACRMPKVATIGPTFRVGVIVIGWRVSLFMRRAYLFP